MASVWYEIGRALRQVLIGAGAKRPAQGTPSMRGHRPGQKPSPRTQPGRSVDPFEASPGQFGDGQTRDIAASELDRVRFTYAPNHDGDPDPGEVIWTWVPYIENDGRGKDRPVLIIGRIDANTVVGCYLSTKHHRDFISIGAGAWDPQRRESFLSPERLLRITHEGMRRESVHVDRKRFDTVLAGVRAFHGLQ